jgi:hypothetical protein
MSPTPFRYVRVRAWSLIPICIVVMAVVLMWTRQPCPYSPTNTDIRSGG